ncbi:hypothetical protein FOZ60_015092 [Perkinsus olseni]|uniref:Uncharacterized protein n=1 Tax=Perkinsus olseni TaxID=32597 RepID=A0A7J6P7C0_PEROL|nr:hypothetical protein FOZ60_015092 [Perkinsus olseni]
MYSLSTALYFILVAAQQHSDVLLGNNKNSPAGLRSQVEIQFTLYNSSTGEPDIRRFQFTSLQGGKVVITPIQGRLPKGRYECGYDLARDNSTGRYYLTLRDECFEVVADSSGYYDNYFLSGCSIQPSYEYLYVPTATTGYDVYQSSTTITTTTPTVTTTTRATSASSGDCCSTLTAKLLISTALLVFW